MTTTENKPTPAAKAAATRARNRDKKNQAIALSIAQAWHRNISPLYSADCGSIEYGGGVHEAESRSRYSRAWHRAHGPSKWKNAGVERDVATGEVRIYPTRGRVIVLDTPRSLVTATLAPLSALLDGDLYGVVGAGGTVTRYGVRGMTGVAVPSVRGQGHCSWEHGATLAECRAEARRKQLLFIERYRTATETEKERLRADRRARLVIALCRKATATIEDARKLGFCRAGIEAFQARYSIGDRATLRALVATGNAEAIRLARVVAGKLKKVPCG